MLVPGPPSPDVWPPKRRRAWAALIVPIGLVVGLLIGSFTVTLPYYSLAPGTARQVDDLIEAPEGNEHPTKGQVLFTTVSLRHATAFDALVGWLDPDIDVVDEDDIVPPDTSTDEYRKLNLQLMDDSKQTAVVVALRRLGHEVPETGDGALVAGVKPGLPAHGRLQPGETIVGVDGRPTTLSSQAVAAIRARKPGDVVRLDVKPAPEAGGDGTPRVEEITLAANPDGSGGPLLGVELRTANQRFDMPFDVDIRSGRVGGPSAGLAFTLGVLDLLTEGELTGGRKVAATGTIEIDGRVGDVGGVAQKTAAVRDAGADLFLVPEGEYDIARARAGSDLKVVKVRDLQDALDALADFGGDLAALGPAPGQG